MFEMNPALLAADKTCAMLEDGFVPTDLNSQYQVLMANDLTGTETRKPVKKKAKAKAKPKAKAAIVSQVSKAGDSEAKWFVRVDTATKFYQTTTSDPRCPAWKDVRFRRTYDLNSGALICSESCQDLSLSNAARLIAEARREISQHFYMLGRTSMRVRWSSKLNSCKNRWKTGREQGVPDPG